MARIVKIICDICGADENESLYLVGSDDADIHICNYCLDEMNLKAVKHLEKRGIDINGGVNNDRA